MSTTKEPAMTRYLEITSAPEPESDDCPGTTTAAIAFFAVGSVLFLATFFFWMKVYCRKRRSRHFGSRRPLPLTPPTISHVVDASGEYLDLQESGIQSYESVERERESSKMIAYVPTDGLEETYDGSRMPKQEAPKPPSLVPKNVVRPYASDSVADEETNIFKPATINKTVDSKEIGATLDDKSNTLSMGDKYSDNGLGEKTNDEDVDYLQTSLVHRTKDGEYLDTDSDKKNMADEYVESDINEDNSEHASEDSDKQPAQLQESVHKDYEPQESQTNIGSISSWSNTNQENSTGTELKPRSFPNRIPTIPGKTTKTNKRWRFVLKSLP